MAVSDMKIIDIEQGSDRWHEERFRCVTGTRFESAIGACFSNATCHWSMGGRSWAFSDGALIDVTESVSEKKQASLLAASKSKQQTLLLELVSEYQSELEIDDYCSETMERGNDLEPVSLILASERHKVNFEPCGMLQHDTIKEFKFSPDAICKDKNGVIIGGYETKSKAGKYHIECMINNVVPKEHLLQCLCPMVMSDHVKCWVFGHYDDRNHVNNLFTAGIKRDDYEEFIQASRSVLIEFIKEVNEAVEKMGGVYHG